MGAGISAPASFNLDPVEQSEPRAFPLMSRIGWRLCTSSLSLCSPESYSPCQARGPLSGEDRRPSGPEAAARASRKAGKTEAPGEACFRAASEGPRAKGHRYLVWEKKELLSGAHGGSKPDPNVSLGLKLSFLINPDSNHSLRGSVKFKLKRH